LFLAFAISACVGGKQQISAEDRERLKAYILESVPPDAHKIDVNFENKVHLVGYKLEPETAPPGTQVKVTYYWRCDDPLDEGWMLFTHLQHEGFDKPDNLDGNGPLREVKGKGQVAGPDRWERGKFYADEQTFTMPQALKGPESTLYVGIWKNAPGEPRLRIVGGPTDGENRAIVAKIKTGIAPRKEEKRGASDVPTLEVMKLAAGEKFVIDGKPDDKAWGGAASTGPFVDVGSGKPVPAGSVGGSAKMAWDDDNLYVLVDVKDKDVTGYFTNKEEQPKDFTVTGQPKTWERHTAELMIDPDGDGDNKDYYEIQINPQNRGFHSQFDTKNQPAPTGPNGPYGHEDWDPKLKSAVVVHGTLDKHDDEDQGYTIEMQIPWKAFSKGAKQLPPKGGDAWRMNMYAMVDNGGAAWSPILGRGNFHTAPRFARVTWITKEWVAAQADAGAGDAGAAADAGADAGARDGGGLLRQIRRGDPSGLKDFVPPTPPQP
jgi:hypothetical protein